MEKREREREGVKRQGKGTKRKKRRTETEESTAPGTATTATANSVSITTFPSAKTQKSKTYSLHVSVRPLFPIENPEPSFTLSTLSTLPNRHGLAQREAADSFWG